MLRPSAPRAQVRAFLRHQRATLARLRRVNAALDRWAEVEAAAAMPPESRPTVEPPRVSWASLKELQAMLCDVLGELEEEWDAWQGERRH
jgi:hypothetical protein